MNALIAAEFDAPDLMEEPVDAWSLDELDRDSDLESLHWALERRDDAGF
ncbi:MAG TPA: hypothetical protein VIQ55_11995 [Burkholderiales bacterium]